jgi:hypothetical protein
MYLTYPAQAEGKVDISHIIARSIINFDTYRIIGTTGSVRIVPLCYQGYLLSVYQKSQSLCKSNLRRNLTTSTGGTSMVSILTRSMFNHPPSSHMRDIRVISAISAF